VLALGACGSDDAAPDERESTGGEVVDISGTEPVGEVTAGSVARLATCRDWNGANSEQKLATIEDVRNQLNPNDPGIQAPQLTDEEALTAFDDACEASWAQGFRLYKLYARAVSFVPLKRELSD
jgi:hypothetical protein